MGEPLRRTAARHPGRALGVLAAVAVLGTGLAAGWSDQLAISSHDSRAAPLRVEVRGGLPASSPAFRVAVRTMRAQLASNPAVAGVRERRGGPAESVLVVRFEAVGGRRDAAIERIERNLDPGPLTIAFRGPVAEARAAKDDALDDLVLLLAALPVVALVAAGTLGVRPAGAALLAAGAASALACLACELLAEAIDVYWLALVGAVAGGSLLGLQLCAMARAGATAGTVWAAALAGAATFGATALLGVDYLASLGLGGGLGSLLAAPAALVAMGAAGGGIDPAESERGAALWRAIGGLLGWSRLVAAAITLLALGLLLSMVAPVERLATAAIGAPAAPGIEATELAAAAGAAALVTALLGAVLGRPGLAVLATAAFALPTAAVAGLLVASFQEAWLEGPLDYVSIGAVQLGSLAGAVGVVAALCATQAVALVAAAVRAGSGGPGERVAEAMGRAGPPAALACLAGTAAGIALGFGSEGFVKQFGLGSAAGLLLLLVVVQALISPALLRFTTGRASRE